MTESAGLRAGYFAAAAAVRPTLNAIMSKEWQGREHLPEDGFILCANHLSNLDPLALGHMVYSLGYLPYFLAKAELFQLPVVGGLLTRMRQIPVDRARGGNESLLTANQVLADGGAIIIYPESTLTTDPDLWPMKAKTGAARLALETGVPVIPVAQWGIHEVMPRPARAPKPWPRRTGRIRIGAPVPLEDLRDSPLTRDVLDSASERIMSAITGELEVLRGEPAPSGRWNPRTARREPTPGRPGPGGALPDRGTA
ncbi:lysophospholipid acyltransferase family protein [Citricoccus sp. NPDC055426]|uniref:lysophospholipid acyltransferase family protein n=1 Tax=Citricoccus sp. NPDC055426 TaxID=3155536 RepID=UPI00343E61A6